jgi:hypothetical protein
MKSNEKKCESGCETIGFRIDPNAVYDASECRKRHEGGEACHDCAGGEDGEEDEDCSYFSG